MPKWLSKVLKAWEIEKTFRIGRYNLRWSRNIFIAWLVFVITGFSMTYMPFEDKNPLKGFAFELGGGPPIWLTLILILSFPACMFGLVICYHKGLIDKDDF